MTLIFACLKFAIVKAMRPDAREMPSQWIFLTHSNFKEISRGNYC